MNTTSARHRWPRAERDKQTWKCVGISFGRDNVTLSGLTFAEAEAILNRYDGSEAISMAASEEALVIIRESSRSPDLQICDAKKFIRTQGPDGVALAARFGNQSETRVASAHPIGSLLRDLRQFSRRHERRWQVASATGSTGYNSEHANTSDEDDTTKSDSTIGTPEKSLREYSS